MGGVGEWRVIKCSRVIKKASAFGGYNE